MELELRLGRGPSARHLPVLVLPLLALTLFLSLFLSLDRAGANQAGADIAVVVGAPTEVVEGAYALVPVTVVNNGAAAAEQVELVVGPAVGFRGDAQASAVLDDPACTGSVCSWPTIAGGGATTVVVRVTLLTSHVGSAHHPDTGTFRIDAAATTSSPDVDAGNNADARHVQLLRTTGLVVGGNDVTRLNGVAFGPLVPGDQVRLRVEVENLDAGVQTLSLAIDSPAGMQVVTAVLEAQAGSGFLSCATPPGGAVPQCPDPVGAELSGGFFGTFSITFEVTSAAAAGERIFFGFAAMLSGNQSQERTTLVDISTSAATDLSVSVTGPSAGPVVAGQVYRYEIALTNHGPADASDVRVELRGDTLDTATVPGSCDAVETAGDIDRSCTWTSVPAGASVSWLLDVTVPYYAGDPGYFDLPDTYAVGARIAYAGQDADPLNNQADSAPLAISRTAILSVGELRVAFQDPGPLQPGDTVGWELDIDNQGPSGAYVTTVFDLPDGLVLNNTGWGCEQYERTVLCAAFNQEAQPPGTQTLGFITTISSGFGGGEITLTTATRANESPAPQVRSATITTAAPDDVVVALRPLVAAGTAGAPATWTVTVTNPGPARDLVLSLEGTSGVASGLDCVPNGALVSCALGVVPAGGEVSAEVTSVVRLLIAAARLATDGTQVGASQVDTHHYVYRRVQQNDIETAGPSIEVGEEFVWRVVMDPGQSIFLVPAFYNLTELSRELTTDADGTSHLALRLRAEAAGTYELWVSGASIGPFASVEVFNTEPAPTPTPTPAVSPTPTVAAGNDANNQAQQPGLAFTGAATDLLVVLGSTLVLAGLLLLTARQRSLGSGRL